MSEAKPIIRRTLAENLLACTAHQGQDSEAAAFGRAFHSFAASYALVCREAGEETRLGDVQQLATDAFFRSRGASPNRLPEFIELCEDFARTRMAGLDTLVSLEQTLTHDVGWALLTCTLDRVDRSDDGDPDDEAEELLDTDFKTEWTLEGDHSFQIRWYVQMQFLTHPRLRRIGFRIDLVRRRWQPEVLWFERGELDDWWATTLAALQEAWEIQQAGRGVPTGGSACTFCAKRYSCGAAVASAAVLPENDDQAGEIISDWLRLQAAATERQEALKVFFKDRDPMVFNGLEVGYLLSREPTPQTTDPQAIVEWLNRRSELPLEGEAALKLSIDWPQIKAFWAELVEEGLAFLPETPAFRSRKAQLARRAKKPAPAAEVASSDASDAPALAGPGREAASAASESLTELGRRAARRLQ